MKGRSGSFGAGQPGTPTVHSTFSRRYIYVIIRIPSLLMVSMAIEGDRHDIMGDGASGLRGGISDWRMTGILSRMENNIIRWRRSFALV